MILCYMKRTAEAVLFYDSYVVEGSTDDLIQTICTQNKNGLPKQSVLFLVEIAARARRGV